MLKKICFKLGLILSVVLIPLVSVQAGEIDLLVKKLVEKGILSPVEAQILIDETKKEVAQEIAKGKSSSLPKWVQNIKVKQDLRIRHQYERRTNDTEGRNRGRIRYRLGIETKVVDGVKAAIGLATGGDDPRSTNQTLQSFFDSPDIRLDYAYAEYAPNSNMKIAAGKHKRKAYLWSPTDMLWDTDIRPEGAAAHFQTILLDNMDGWINAGVWVLDTNDQTDRPDPFMNFVQAGISFNEGNIDAKLASVYYGFNGVKGLSQYTRSSKTNTTTGGVLKYDYDSVGVSTEFGVKYFFGGLPLNIDERIALLGDFIYNMDAPDEAIGWSVGVKFGNKKAKKQGQWQAKYIYANLGKDAFLDTFPDSDRYGGATDVKSHEFAINYAWKKGVILGVDYYNSDRIKASSNPEQIVQADVQLKF